MLEISGMQVSVGEIQRAYLYKLYIESYPSAVAAEYAEAPQLQSAIDLYQQKGVWFEQTTEEITIKWGGEFTTYSGVDASNRKADLEFILDEEHRIEDFFRACKACTGNLENHAALKKKDQCLTLGVAQVSVDKNTITDYARLSWVKVIGVKHQSNPDKAANNESRLVVSISWDKNKPDKTKRGLTC